MTKAVWFLAILLLHRQCAASLTVPLSFSRALSFSLYLPSPPTSTSRFSLIDCFPLTCQRPRLIRSCLVVVDEGVRPGVQSAKAALWLQVAVFTCHHLAPHWLTRPTESSSGIRGRSQVTAVCLRLSGGFLAARGFVTLGRRCGIYSLVVWDAQPESWALLVCGCMCVCVCMCAHIPHMWHGWWERSLSHYNSMQLSFKTVAVVWFRVQHFLYHASLKT